MVVIANDCVGGELYRLLKHLTNANKMAIILKNNL